MNGEITSSQDKPQEIGHGRRKGVVAQKAPTIVGADKASVPRKPKLASLS